MAVASSTFRNRMLLTTAVAAITAIPSAAHAQLVDSGDLSSAVDSAGNTGQLTVTDTSATQTDIEVEAAVVVAEWTDFNVDMGDTVNVTIDAGLGLTEATLFNRVIGGNPSNINGTINATDVNFWLVNQNGIMFGADATVNARSFLASTNDVANQDIFDFYEGTDLFGNGSTTLGFVDPSAGTAQTITAATGATFVTDGSLGFVGQGLNLNASFDAGSGRAFFIAASDIDVTFTPNSPLFYTVNAGTTVATQVIDGSVTAGAAEFALFNSAGVVGALLQVDASVNATNVSTDGNRVSLVALPFGAAQPDIVVTDAIAADGNITILAGGSITATSLDADEGGGVDLSANGNITTTSITSNEPGATNGFIDVDSTGGGNLDLGTVSSDGDIAIDTTGSLTTASITTLNDLTIGGVADPSSITFTGNVDADIIEIDSTGAVNALALDATDGDLNVSASSISAGAVSATEGDVILAASGNITTTSITSTEVFGTGGDINIDSTSGGTLNLGTVTGDGAANFDTTGTLTLGTVDVGGAMVIGGTADPSTLNLNGDITAGSFTSVSTNVFSTLNDITATDGNLTITASAIGANNLEADEGGGVILSATGDIVTNSITANEPGATNGFIDVDSNNGDLDLGSLTSDGDISVTTDSGNVTISTVSSLGDFVVGEGLDIPGTVTFTGGVSADDILVAGQNIQTQALTATDGGIQVVGSSTLSVASATATGGTINLQANNGVTITGSVTSNEDVLNMGGNVILLSTGGPVSVTDITADGTVQLEATGTLSFNAIDAGGALTIGSVFEPTALSVTGNITAGSVDITTNSIIDLNDVTATDGNLELTTDFNIVTGDLEADEGGGVILTTLADITTNSITANEPGVTNGFIDVQSTGGGDLDLGNLTSDGDIEIDSTGAITTGSINSLGDLDIGLGGSSTSLTLGGAVDADAVFISTGALTASTIDATDGDLTIGAQTIDATDLSATGGNVTLQANGAITTTSITANEDFALVGGDIAVKSTAGGDLTLGDLTSDGDTMLDTSAVLTYGLATIGGTLTIGSMIVPSQVNAGAILSNTDIIINSVNAVDVGNVTTTNGLIDITAPTITAEHVSATGGDVTLTSPGFINTTSITSIESGGAGGNIAVKSTGGSDLDLGDLTADGTVMLDTTGSIQTGMVDADGALSVGSMLTPSFVRFTGNVTAGSIDIDVAGNLRTEDLTADDGDIDIDAAFVNAGDFSATGNLDVDATDAINMGSATADSDSMGGGDLTIGGTTMPSALRMSDNASGANVSLTSAAVLETQDVTASNGDVTLGGTRITALDVEATDNVNVTGTTLIDLASAVADSDTSGMGDVTLATTAAVADTRVLGAVSGANVTVTSHEIRLGDVHATAGDAIITADEGVTTDSITATAAGMVGGNIDVESTGWMDLILGDLAAAGDIDLDANGSVVAGTITAGGALTVGGVTMPSFVHFTGDASAASMDINSVGNLRAQDLTATAGDIDIDTTGVIAMDLSATGNIEIDAAGAVTIGSATADSDSDLAGDLTIGMGTAPSSLRMSGDATGANVTLASGGVLETQNVTATSGDATLSGTRVTALAVQATGDVSATGTTLIDLSSAVADSDTSGMGDLTLTTTAGAAEINVPGTVSGANVTITGDEMMLGAVDATAGDATIVTTGSVTTTSITANAAGGDISVSGNNSSTLDLGDITADGMATFDTGGTLDLDTVTIGGALVIAKVPDTLNLNGDITAGSFAYDTPDDFEAQNITITNGDLDIDAASIETGNVSANGNIELDANGAIVIGSATAGGDLDIGLTTMPSSLRLNGDASASTVDLESAGIIVAQDVNATGGDANLSGTRVTALDVAATNNIAIAATDRIDLSSAIADSDSAGGGDLALTTTGVSARIVVDNASSGENVTIGGNVVQLGSVTATAGDATINANSISATTVVTTGGDALLTSAGAVTTTSITANGGLIDVQSLGTGTLDLGALNADNGVTLESGGRILTDAIIADDDANGVGDLTIVGTGLPTRVRISGAASGANITINTTGPLTAQALTATVGDVDVDAGSIAAGAVTAMGNIELDAAGAINVAGATAGGDLEIGTTTSPIALTLTADASGQNATLNSTGRIAAQNVTATGGDVAIDGARVQALAVTATNDVSVTADMRIDLTSAAADSDASTMGDLTLTNTAPPGLLRVTGAATGVNVSATGGAIVLGSAAASGGDVALDGSSINTGALSATGGNVDLEATGNIRTGNATATASGGSGGMVDVDSTGGGRVELADIAAEAGVSLDTTGRLITGMIKADSDGDLSGALQVGGTAEPSGVTFGGDVSASDVDIDTTGALVGANITATNGDVDIDAGSINAGSVSASNAIMLDATGPITIASASAATDLTIGTTTAPSRIDVAGASTGTNATLVSNGSVDVGTVTATSGIVDIDGGTSVSASGIVSATGDVTIDTPGAVSVVTVTADSDNSGAGDALIGTNTRASSIAATDGVEGVAVTLLASGGGVNIGTNAASLGLVATNGDVTVNATDPNSSNASISITPTASATGGNVLLEADRAITADQLVAQTSGGNGGTIVVNSLEGGAINLGALLADNGVAIDTLNDVNATSVDTDADNNSVGGLVIGGVNAPSDVTFIADVSATDVAIDVTGAVTGLDINATAGDIDIDAGQITADNVAATGDVELDAGQAIMLASVNGGGALTIGTTTAPSSLSVTGAVDGSSVDIVSDGDVTTGDITASAGDTSLVSGGDVMIGAVSTTALDVSAANDLTIMGAVTAGGDAVLQADDIDLQAAVNANGQSVTLRANGDQDVGVGSAAGAFQISDAELDLIDADTLVIDAGPRAITISDVTFTGQAGASEVVFATTGGSNANIEITGDITANGNGRVFRMGGDADGNGLANRIRANVETATIDLDLSTLDLRATDIVFGQTELFNAVNNRSSEFIGVNIVGNAGSILFNPREPVAGARTVDPVYLKVGNLDVTYAETALFQNMIPLQEGMLEFAGVEIGTDGGTGSLRLNPTDTTNAFGFFGSLNELDGDAVAFAPEPFLFLNGNVRIFSSRANGCVIRTGADCVTTVVDSTIISIPREAVSLLTADTGLLVPFDPLVGTNNEGLFSGAATAPGDEECERDENGQCI